MPFQRHPTVLIMMLMGGSISGHNHFPSWLSLSLSPPPLLSMLYPEGFLLLPLVLLRRRWMSAGGERETEKGRQPLFPHILILGWRKRLAVVEQTSWRIIYIAFRHETIIHNHSTVGFFVFFLVFFAGFGLLMTLHLTLHARTHSSPSNSLWMGRFRDDRLTCEVY